MEERDRMHQAKSEGLSVNMNKMPVYTEGEISGANGATKANFAKLMGLQGKGGKKQMSHKDQKRVNYKLHEKRQQAWSKAKEAQMEEQRIKDEQEWAPQGKDDEKYQKKMQQKVDKFNDDGPTKSEQKKNLEMEDEMINGKK